MSRHGIGETFAENIEARIENIHPVEHACRVQGIRERVRIVGRHIQRVEFFAQLFEALSVVRQEVAQTAFLQIRVEIPFEIRTGEQIVFHGVRGAFQAGKKRFDVGRADAFAEGRMRNIDRIRRFEQMSELAPDLAFVRQFAPGRADDRGEIVARPGPGEFSEQDLRIFQLIPDDHLRESVREIPVGERPAAVFIGGLFLFDLHREEEDRQRRHDLQENEESVQGRKDADRPDPFDEIPCHVALGMGGGEVAELVRDQHAQRLRVHGTERRVADDQDVPPQKRQERHMGNERQRLRHAEINPVDAPGAQFAAYFPDVVVQRAVFSRFQIKQVLPRFVADHVMQHAKGTADHDDEKDPFF